MTRIWCILTLLAVVLFCQGWAQVAQAGSYDTASPSMRAIEDMPVSDINQDPNKAEILQVISRRIMQGFPDGTFRPNAAVTESAFAKVLERFLVACPGAYDAAFEAKDPNVEISRVRAIAFLLRSAASTNAVQSTVDPQGKFSKFIDGSSVPGWSQKYMAFAIEHEFIKGGQALRPMEPLTRSELAGFVARALAWTAANPVSSGNPPAPAAVRKPVIYTSLVIDCRGLGINRSMCPEVLDEDGVKIYPDPKNAPSIDFVETQGLVTYANELSESKKAGDNPLVIRAIDVTGTANQAAIISDEDKQLVIAEEKNSKFLSKWNVVFIKD